jgi:hypothetical protein
MFLPSTRENHRPRGFAFDQSTFEDLIDSFTPKDDIAVILGVPPMELDRFCKIVYGMTYAETYDKLIRMSKAIFRKVVVGLAAKGNTTALNLAATNFANLQGEDENKALKVVIVDDIPKDGEK